MRRLAALAAAAALLCAPAGAAGLPLLAPGDATELAELLAEAEAAQGICYGWYVTIDDASGALDGVEAGSSRGAGIPLNASSCPRHVLFVGAIRYVSESSESEDSAEIGVESDLDPPVTTGDLKRLGLTGGDLLGGSDDVALVNMVGAMPLLAAETGAAPFMPFAASTAPLLPGEMPTGSPGSDWWRAFWPHVVVAGALSLLVGVAIGFFAAGGRPRPAAPTRPRAHHARTRPRLP